MLRYTGVTYGKVTIEQHYKEIKRRFVIDIREGNCLAVFVHIRKATEDELKDDPEGKYVHTLYSFLADEQHAKNILKHDKLFGNDKVVKIDLNLHYKESWTLLKYFMKSGYRVNCYTEEPKSK